jgi:hypothetical protein
MFRSFNCPRSKGLKGISQVKKNNNVKQKYNEALRFLQIKRVFDEYLRSILKKEIRRIIYTA